MRRARRRAIAGTHPSQSAQRDGAGCDADRLGDAGKVSGRHCSSTDKRNGGSAWVSCQFRFGHTVRNEPPGLPHPMSPQLLWCWECRNCLVVPPAYSSDRKSGVSGKSVSVRVDLGGLCIIKYKKYYVLRDNITTIKYRT